MSASNSTGFYIDGFKNSSENPTKLGSVDVDSDKILQAWKELNSIANHDANKRACAYCWSTVKKIAREVMDDVNDDEVCRFLSVSHPLTVRAAVVLGEDNPFDHGLSLQRLCDSLERNKNPPHLAVVGQDECESVIKAFRSISLQLIHSVEEEKNRNVNKAESPLDTQGCAQPRSNRSYSLRRDISQGTNTEYSFHESPPEEDQRFSEVLCKRRLQSSKVYDMEYVCSMLSKSLAERNAAVLSDIENHESTINEASIHMNPNGSRSPIAVVVLEDVAKIPTHVFRQILVALAHYHVEHCTRFAVVLALQRSNYSWTLDGVLRRREALPFRIRKFKPTPVRIVMNTIFDRLFLQGKSPLRLSHSAAVWFSEQFLGTENSLKWFMDALHLAILHHYAKFRTAFVNVTAQHLHQYDNHPLYSDDMKEISKLPTIKGELDQIKEKPAKREFIWKLIDQQEENRRLWPCILKLICIAKSFFGSVVSSNLRKELCSISSKTMKGLREKIKNCDIEDVDSLVKKFGETLEDEVYLPSLVECIYSYKNDRESRSVIEAPQVGSNRSFENRFDKNQRINARRVSLQRREVLKKSLIHRKAPDKHASSRQIVLSWWDNSVAKGWDADRLPLGELFFFQGHDFLNNLLHSQPLATITKSLETNPSLGMDTCLAYISMRELSIAHQLPFLDWFESFCEGIGKKFSDSVENVEVIARFLQACAELELLGFTLTSETSSNYTTVTIRTSF